VVSALASRLPRGGTLPPEVWRSRHRGITGLLWLHVAALAVLGVLRGFDAHQVTWLVAVVAAFAAAAGLSRLGMTVRSAMTTLGLVSACAATVYFFDGMTEAHFEYFVVVAVVALYQAWWPYLLAVGFVLLEHGVVGGIAPGLVYNHLGTMSPWQTAAVHGGFICAESIACVLYWRVSEDALDRERNAHTEAQQARRSLDRAQELAQIGSWTLDLAGNSFTWSEQMYSLTGRDPASYQPPATAEIDMVHPDDKEWVATLVTDATRDGSSLDLEYRLLLPDLEVRIVHARSQRPVDADGTSRKRIGTLHDVTERKALQQEIEHLAYHDALTGLANRRLFLARLELALAGRRATDRTCAVLYLDLDDFKSINDTMGHSVGDEILRVTAQRLNDKVRAADTVGRLGGDEFAILLDDVDSDTTSFIAEAIGIDVRRPIQLEGSALCVGCSIGFALADEYLTADDLMRNADAAMYAMKTRANDAAGRFPADPSRY
jgi:diguanylate cyclase (GGDEF)-like protein